MAAALTKTRLPEVNFVEADWQLHAYGHTTHAFTASGVNLPERGLVYNSTAD